MSSAYDIEAINSLVAPEITNTTYSQCINVASKWIVVEDWLDHPLINIDHGEYDGLFGSRRCENSLTNNSIFVSVSAIENYLTSKSVTKMSSRSLCCRCIRKRITRGEIICNNMYNK